MEQVNLIHPGKYCESLTEYKRRITREVPIGDVPLGGTNPIRLQSMTVVDTMDTKGSVEQAIRMIEAGCEYVRITAPSLEQAKNLENIRRELRSMGYNTPLVADIHFTPAAAEEAARLVEKVRINPGNYADKKRFQQIEYSDVDYQAELDRIRDRFLPLIKICQEYGTALRIGTNHGSLSDRIMSRYGDTPLGMVESALEFLRICEDENYYDIVLSMKASNPLVMVEAYRLLVNKLDVEGFQPYPLHLGVTEAGEGEDGRIKSAAGIGTLLEDGLGDTVRVSLTEDPEFEIPVARMLVDRYKNREGHAPILPLDELPKDPFVYEKRITHEVENIGGSHVPRVIADFSQVNVGNFKDLKSIGHFFLPELDKWKMNDLGADYIYTGNTPIPFMLPNGLKEILNYNVWYTHEDKTNKYPLITTKELSGESKLHPSINFLKVTLDDWSRDLKQLLADRRNLVLLLQTENEHAMPELRRFFFELFIEGITTPVIITRSYKNINEEQFQLFSATDGAGLLIDGFGDGLMLSWDHSSETLKAKEVENKTAFGILQAARTRMSKTEYISCPSCGRTYFDLQETTAMIRKHTDHLKGVKIGIMGCIVNGPGEMADADYGYVGSGKGIITLYRGKEVVKRNLASDNAVVELIQLIKEDGNWVDPE